MARISSRVDIARTASSQPPVAKIAGPGGEPWPGASKGVPKPEGDEGTYTSQQVRADIERQEQEALARSRESAAQYRRTGDLPLRSPPAYSRTATVAKQFKAKAEKEIGTAGVEAVKELNKALTGSRVRFTIQGTTQMPLIRMKTKQRETTPLTFHQWLGKYGDFAKPDKAKYQKYLDEFAQKSTRWSPQDVYNYYREHGGVATTPSFESSYRIWKLNPTPFPALPASISTFTVKSNFQIITSGMTRAIKDLSTGGIVGYLGTGNTITDIHGTVIGIYKDERNIELATLQPLPKRTGLPPCAEKNYDKAKIYLDSLIAKGEVPEGSTLVQTTDGWKYKLPTIESGAVVYKPNKAYLVGTTGKFYINPDDPSRGTTDIDFMSKNWCVGELSESGWYVWTGTKWAETGTNEANIAAVKGFAGQGVAEYKKGRDIKLYYPTKDSVGIVVPTGGIVKLKNGELVPRIYYDALPEGEQNFLYKYGIDEYSRAYNPLVGYEGATKLFSNKELLARQEEWKKSGVTTATMPYILWLGKVPDRIYDTSYSEAMSKVRELGVDGYNKWVEMNTIELNSGELVPKDAFDKLTLAQQKELIECGSVEKFNELHPPPTKGQIAKEIGISQIPVYYTVRSWNTSANWERALNIATDLLWIIPPARIAAGVARGAVGASRIARIAEISKAVAVAEFIAPVKALRYPIRAIKFVAEPLEALIRGSKIPIESVSQSYHTIKIPSIVAREKGLEHLGVSVEEATRARNVIVPQVIAGETGAFYGKELEALMKPSVLSSIKPCAVSGTPDIRPFLYGATVNADLYVGPTFYERFAHATSAGRTTEGGIKGALVITDEKVLKALKLLPSKTYMGAAEFEEILKTGYKLPPPSQILFTRSLGVEKLTLLIIGPKFTAGEIAKLKFIAPVETFKQIFSRPLKLTAKQLAEQRRLETKLASIEHKLAETSKLTKTEIKELEAQKGKLLTELSDSYRRQAVPMLIDSTDGRYIRLLEEAANQARRVSRVERISVAPRVARVTRLPVAEKVARVPRVGRVSREARVPRIPQRVEVPRISRVARVERVPGVGRVPGVTRIPEVPRIPQIPKIPKVPKVPKIPEYKAEVGGKKVRKFPLGSVCWRQGLFWITIYPPYRAENVLYTREPPRNVRIVTGLKSAYKTITKLGFQVPEKVLKDMGIMDVIISGRGQKITFKRDIKRRTRLGYPEGVPPGIKMGMLG